MSLKKVSKATLRRDATTVVHKATLVTMVQDLQKQVLHDQQEIKYVKTELATMMAVLMRTKTKTIVDAMNNAKKRSGKVKEMSCQSSPTKLGRLQKLTQIPDVMTTDGNSRARKK